MKYLDVSDIIYDASEWPKTLPFGTFPPTIETLKISNSPDFIICPDKEIIQRLASAYKHLRYLDISINDMDMSLLVELSEGLKVLEYLDVCGELIMYHLQIILSPSFLPLLGKAVMYMLLDSHCILASITLYHILVFLFAYCCHL